MKIPSRGIAKWAGEIRDQCLVSTTERVQRGAQYKNLFLTGDQDGVPQTYVRANGYIQDKASYLYSPVELRFSAEHYGNVSAADRAKAKSATAEVLKRTRRDGVDRKAQGAVIWSLVKGKTFIKLLWGENAFQPHLIQPEYMGVLYEHKDELTPNMGAFVQTAYITEDELDAMIEHYDTGEKTDIKRRVQRYFNQQTPDGRGVAGSNWLKQVVLGGLNPYQQAGSSKPQNRGVVDWLNGPRPMFDTRTLASIARLDELWVWSSEDDDWRTIQLIGDVMVSPKERLINAFADDVNADPSLKDEHNPLRSSHPFIEFCANEMDGYFWGDSEIRLVALLQRQLNMTIDGINHLLRMQEFPPKFFKNISGQAQNAASRLNKPRGYFSDSNPQADVKNLAPEIPAGLWERLHETEAMFDNTGGMRAVLRGEGESGVRAQGHAETLTRNASPRFKDDAIVIERNVENLGGLALDMLKAHVPDKLIAWLMPGEKSVEAEEIPDIAEIGEEPPAEGMKPILFRLSQLSPNTKLTVDAHSSSPIFSQEARELLFELNKRGAVTPEELVQHTNPPGADSIISSIERRKVESSKQIAALPPEDRVKVMTGRKR